MMGITSFLQQVWQQPTVESQQDLIQDQLCLTVLAVGSVPTSGSKADGLLLHTEKGMWCVLAQTHPTAKKLKAIAPFEGNKAWWVAMLIDGSALDSQSLRVMPGTVRSLDDAELNLLGVHVRAYQESVVLDSVLSAARVLWKSEPSWSFGRCVFSKLPAFVTAQIIDTDLNMYHMSEEKQVIDALSKVAAQFPMV